MRFKRSDLGAIAIAALVPAVLSYIVFVGWQLQHHEGTPLLGIVSGNFAVGGGIIAYLMRYVTHRRAFGAIAVLLGLCFIGVIGMQYAEMDKGIAATALKFLGIVLFLALNAVLAWDVLATAVNPYLVRRDERRAAGN